MTYLCQQLVRTNAPKKQQTILNAIDLLVLHENLVESGYRGKEDNGYTIGRVRPGWDYREASGALTIHIVEKWSPCLTLVPMTPNIKDPPVHSLLSTRLQLEQMLDHAHGLQACV